MSSLAAHTEPAAAQSAGCSPSGILSGLEREALLLPLCRMQQRLQDPAEKMSMTELRRLHRRLREVGLSGFTVLSRAELCRAPSDRGGAGPATSDYGIALV